MIIQGYAKRAEAEDRKNSLGPNTIPPEAPATIFNGNKESWYTVAHKYIISKDYFSIPFYKRCLVFKSVSDFKSYRDNIPDKSSYVLAGEPIFSPFLLKYMVFKRKHPLTSKRYDYCKVYSKFIVGYYVRRFLFEFSPDPTDKSQDFKVVMFLHCYSSFADTIYKGTRIRWNGTTPIGASNGHNHFGMILLNDNEPSLLDGMDVKAMRPAAGTISFPAAMIPGFITKRIPGKFGELCNRFKGSEWPWRCENPFGIFHKYSYNRSGLLDINQVKRNFMFDVRELPEWVPLPSRTAIASGPGDEIVENIYQAGVDIYKTEMREKTSDEIKEETMRQIFKETLDTEVTSQELPVIDRKHDLATAHEDSLVFICMALVLHHQEKERRPRQTYLFRDWSDDFVFPKVIK